MCQVFFYLFPEYLCVPDAVDLRVFTTQTCFARLHFQKVSTTEGSICLIRLFRPSALRGGVFFAWCDWISSRPRQARCWGSPFLFLLWLTAFN